MSAAEATRCSAAEALNDIPAATNKTTSMGSLHEFKIAQRDQEPWMEQRPFGLRRHDAALAARWKHQPGPALRIVQPKRGHVPAVHSSRLASRFVERP